MKEIEILVEVYEELETIKKKLETFTYIGSKNIKDEYYYDPKRDLLKPDNKNQLSHCLRLRSNDNNYFVTYKDDVFDHGKWLYSNEYETKIDSISVMQEIFKNLGLIKFIELDNKKEVYKYHKYEIVIEDVKNLGIFLEVEYCTDKDVDVVKEKEQIQKFIDKLNLNVSEELNMGKPELYMKKHNIQIK